MSRKQSVQGMPTLSVPGWTLRINVNEFNVLELSLRVSGETHIGAVMFQLVEKLNHIKNDWSDFALWWPEKKQWLNKTKLTLDQCGVQADALLHFTRIHKMLRIKLPDMQVVDMSVDFSIQVYFTVKQICKEIGVRHPEEASLMRCPNEKPVKESKKSRTMSPMSVKDKDSSVSSNPSTFNNTKNTRERSQSISTEDDNKTAGSFNGFSNEPQSLSVSPFISTQTYLTNNAIKYKHIFDRTKANAR